MTYLIGVVRRLLAVEVRFETVADRFVQQDPAVAGREHDVHLSGRRLARVEHRDRLPDRFSCVPLGRLAVEVAQIQSAAAAARSGLALAVLLGDGADAEAHERLHVVHELAVARGDQDLAVLLGERRLDALHARIGGARGHVGASQQLALLFARNVERELLDVVAMRRRDRREAHRLERLAAVGDLARDLRGALHRLRREIFGVRVPGRVALADAHAQTERDAAAGGLEDPVLEPVAASDLVLEEEVGVLASAGESDGEKT